MPDELKDSSGVLEGLYPTPEVTQFLTVLLFVSLFDPDRPNKVAAPRWPSQTRVSRPRPPRRRIFPLLVGGGCTVSKFRAACKLEAVKSSTWLGPTRLGPTRLGPSYG